MILNYFLLLAPAITGLAAFLIFWFLLPPKSSKLFFIVLVLWAGAFTSNATALWFLDGIWKPLTQSVTVVLSLLLGPLFLVYHQSLFEGTTQFQIKAKPHFILAFALSLISLLLLSANFLFESSELVNGLNFIQYILVFILPIHISVYLFWVNRHQNIHKQFYRKFYTELERLNEVLNRRILLGIAMIMILYYLLAIAFIAAIGWEILVFVLLTVALVSSFLIIRMISAIRKQQEILESRKAKMKTHHHELGIPVT